MNVGSVGAVTIPPNPDSRSRAQLEHDQKKLDSDTQAGASWPRLAADQLAVARSAQQVVAAQSVTRVDIAL
jgi:hypothetical protein